MEKILKYASMAIGLFVTSLMLIAFGPKIIGEFVEQGTSYFAEVLGSFTNWYDDPTAFFFTYLIGYAIILWRPFWGSVIVLIGDILFFAFNHHNRGILIFIVPTFLVAFLYILYWNIIRKRR